MRNTTIEGVETGSLAKLSPTPKRRSGSTQWAAAVAALSYSINISGITDGPKPVVKPIRVRLSSTEIPESPLKSEEENPKGNKF